MRGGRANPYTELREHCSHGSGYGQTLPGKNRKSCSCPTGPQQQQGPCRRAGPDFERLRDSKESQAGLVGCACVQCCDKNYPEVIFLSTDCVQQAPVCQAGQYPAQDEPRHSREPCWPHSLARDAVPAVPHPRSSAGLWGHLWNVNLT